MWDWLRFAFTCSRRRLAHEGRCTAARAENVRGRGRRTTRQPYRAIPRISYKYMASHLLRTKQPHNGHVLANHVAEISGRAVKTLHAARNAPHGASKWHSSKMTDHESHLCRANLVTMQPFADREGRPDEQVE